MKGVAFLHSRLFTVGGFGKIDTALPFAKGSIITFCKSSWVPISFFETHSALHFEKRDLQ